MKMRAKYFLNRHSVMLTLTFGAVLLMINNYAKNKKHDQICRSVCSVSRTKFLGSLEKKEYEFLRFEMVRSDEAQLFISIEGNGLIKVNGLEVDNNLEKSRGIIKELIESGLFNVSSEVIAFKLRCFSPSWKSDITTSACEESVFTIKLYMKEIPVYFFDLSADELGLLKMNEVSMGEDRILKDAGSIISRTIDEYLWALSM